MKHKEEKKPKSKTIAFDFDGVVAQYSGFNGKDDIQPPIAEVLKAIETLKEKGYKILIYSTRGDAFLKKYCKQFNIPVDYINRRPDKEGDNPGKPIASVYIEDRSICYRGESAKKLIKAIENFKTYWEK